MTNDVPIPGVSSRCMFVFGGLVCSGAEGIHGHQHRLGIGAGQTHNFYSNVKQRSPQGRNECKKVFTMGYDGEGKYTVGK